MISASRFSALCVRDSSGAECSVSATSRADAISVMIEKRRARDSSECKVGRFRSQNEEEEKEYLVSISFDYNTCT